MGNHAAGALIVTNAVSMAERRRPGEEAIDILDEAVKRAKESSEFSSDTEFDDAPWEEGVFRALLIEAFAPGYQSGDEDEFFDDVYLPFKQRYDLC